MSNARSALVLLLALSALPAAARAGGSPENAVLVVDPTNPVSLQVANHYRRVRDLPDRNVLYLAPNPGSYAAFQTSVRPAFLGALEQLGIADHADYVVLSAGSGFQMSAPGLVSDGCSPVTRFAVTTPFALARAYTSIPVGTSSQLANGYYASGDLALAFDAQTAWAAGGPSASGTRYLLATLLGYDGPNGNSVAEILAMIDRSAAADGARPAGTFTFCQTTDIARSGPRHGFYPAAVASITALGLSAQHLMANLPPAGSTCMGIMTGLADPLIDATPLTLAPGSFCDHLTSYAATFDSTAQTKMSRWIAKGASGTSGTVEEPCNYAGKFPHARLHVYSAQGLSLGESWFRSVGFAPFQVLFTGDPLCRPFAYLPVPSLAGVPAGSASGTLALVPGATTPHPTAGIAGFELLVDGVALAEAAPGHTFALDTRALADGWHELRLLAWDTTGVKSKGRAIVPLTTDNYGRSAALAVAPASGDLSTRFDFSVAGAGGTVAELRLLQGSRVAAARAGNGVLSLYGRTLGADRSRLQLEVEFADGRIARSAPVEVDVADAAGTLSGLPPQSFAHTRRARNDQALIVDLPAAFDDALSAATWAVVAPPAQGTLLGGAGSYRVVQPNAGASGADTLVFRVTTPSGTSADATVTIVWSAPATCPAPVNYCAANPNSTGLPASMGWGGSTRIGANDFRISAYDLPATTFGVFFYGDAAVQQPFGDGFRCVGSPVVRLGVQPTSVFGDVERAIDFTQPPFAAGAGALTAGATKRFQFWYRNPAAGGAGFNLTDGLAVTFCP
jgi:hypothetical protein